MGTATVEVSGTDAARWAAELRAALVANAAAGESVSPVQVRRSAELAVAVIGLVFSGVSTAKTLWDWWHSRQPEAVTVTILFGDSTSVDLSGVDGAQLEIIFRQSVSQD